MAHALLEEAETRTAFVECIENRARAYNTRLTSTCEFLVLTIEDFTFPDSDIMLTSLRMKALARNNENVLIYR